MTADQIRAYAQALLVEHAHEVEYLSIHEAAQDSPHVPGGEISSADARVVSDLIASATVTITWPAS